MVIIGYYVMGAYVDRRVCAVRGIQAVIGKNFPVQLGADVHFGVLGAVFGAVVIGFVVFGGNLLTVPAPGRGATAAGQDYQLGRRTDPLPHIEMKSLQRWLNTGCNMLPRNPAIPYPLNYKSGSIITKLWKMMDGGPTVDEIMFLFIRGETHPMMLKSSSGGT